MSKKQLTQSQLYKKYKLLDETKEKIKGQSRQKISKIWQGYRSKKYTIEKLPNYRKQLARATPEKKEILRTKYFDRKEIAVSKLEYGSLKLEKKVRQKYSQSDYYKLAKSKDLDSTIEKIFEGTKKVRYVMVTLKIKLSGTDQIMFVSDVFTDESFYNIQELEVSIMEKILEKLSFVAKYDGFELISKHIRVIYATPEKTTGFKTKRKHKK